MIIYYDSKTGNVERFVRKLSASTGWDCVKVADAPVVSEKGHLITYTTKIGCVPASTERFLQENHPYVLSVSSSGNRNWGPNFALAADKIARQYGIPLLFKFELSGLEQDLQIFMEKAVSYRNRGRLVN